MEMITIPKGGRPPKQYTDTFLAAIAEEYKIMSRAEIAAVHHVSIPTVARWIRIAKDRGMIPNERKPSM